MRRLPKMAAALLAAALAVSAALPALAADPLTTDFKGADLAKLTRWV